MVKNSVDGDDFEQKYKFYYKNFRLRAFKQHQKLNLE